MKAIDVLVEQEPIEFPYYVMRFFVDGNRKITFAGDQLSIGEDYGTKDEIRDALGWLVDQLGGKVKWKK